MNPDLTAFNDYNDENYQCEFTALRKSQVKAKVTLHLSPCRLTEPTVS